MSLVSLAKYVEREKLLAGLGQRILTYNHINHRSDNGHLYQGRSKVSLPRMMSILLPFANVERAMLTRNFGFAVQDWPFRSHIYWHTGVSQFPWLYPMRFEGLLIGSSFNAPSRRRTGCHSKLGHADVLWVRRLN